MQTACRTKLFPFFLSPIFRNISTLSMSGFKNIFEQSLIYNTTCCIFFLNFAFVHVYAVYDIWDVLICSRKLKATHQPLSCG